MSLIQLSNFSSVIKKLFVETKCKSNNKICLITTAKNLNKKNIIKILESQYNFISNKRGNIDFSKIKVNSLNCNIRGKIKRCQYIKNNAIMFNIYKRCIQYKKFILTFSSFREKIDFIDTVESFK